MTAVVINTDVADRGGKAREEITEKQTLHMNSWINITNRNELAYCEGWSLIAFQVPPNQAILWLHDIIISLLIASLSVNLTSPLNPTPKWVTTVLFLQAEAEKDQVTLQKLPKTTISKPMPAEFWSHHSVPCPSCCFSFPNTTPKEYHNANFLTVTKYNQNKPKGANFSTLCSVCPGHSDVKISKLCCHSLCSHSA